MKHCFEKAKKIEHLFYEKLIPEPMSGCILWTACSSPQGYGKFNLDGKYIAAHRFSFLIHNGYLPEDKMILHKCDTPACVNPNHLYAGDRMDNVRDSIVRRRRIEYKMTHCKNGHELNEDNLVYKKDKKLPSGIRKRCKTCEMIHWKKRNEEYKILAKKRKSEIANQKHNADAA